MRGVVPALVFVCSVSVVSRTAPCPDCLHVFRVYGALLL